jgi:toxin ParE1/3/4
LLPREQKSQRVAMADYRLSHRARENLVEIYNFTESQFGAYHAEAYYAGLIRTFGLLADFPAIGQRADALGDGLRRFRFQAHIVFYTTRPDHIDILAVVHGARDMRPELFS